MMKISQYGACWWMRKWNCVAHHVQEENGTDKWWGKWSQCGHFWGGSFFWVSGRDYTVHSVAQQSSSVQQIVLYNLIFQYSDTNNHHPQWMHARTASFMTAVMIILMVFFWHVTGSCEKPVKTALMNLKSYTPCPAPAKGQSCIISNDSPPPYH